MNMINGIHAKNGIKFFFSDKILQSGIYKRYTSIHLFFKMRQVHLILID